MLYMMSLAYFSFVHTIIWLSPLWATHLTFWLLTYLLSLFQSTLYFSLKHARLQTNQVHGYLDYNVIHAYYNHLHHIWNAGPTKLAEPLNVISYIDKAIFISLSHATITLILKSSNLKHHTWFLNALAYGLPSISSSKYFLLAMANIIILGV